MSTRCATWMCEDGEPVAKVYRHTDGYPEGHGADLAEFFEAVESQTSDTRYGDPTYLAAKLVVWLAGEFATDRDDPKPLAFLGVGVYCGADPGDIAYLYRVHTDRVDENGRPVAECFSVPYDWSGDLADAELVEIPVEGA